MDNHLNRGKLNIGLIQDKAKKQFVDLLDTCEGTKTLIWEDRSLSSSFGLIAKFSLLKERDVTKMHILSSNLPSDSLQTDNVIFIVRPNIAQMNQISDIVHRHCIADVGKSAKVKKWHLYFVSKGSFICEDHLKNKGVYGSFSTIEELSYCMLFPFDNDVLCMELDDAFKEYQVDNDPSCLYSSAEAILFLQDIYGPARQVCGKGDAAVRVWKLVNRLAKECKNSAGCALKTGQAQGAQPFRSQIDQLLMLDRNVDLISPLATQLTYEGLLDEFFGVNNCMVSLPGDKFTKGKEDNSIYDAAQSSEKFKKLELNSADEIFAEIRDKNFQAVSQVLKQRTKQMASQFEERNQGGVQELKQFVKKIPQLMALKESLSNHTTVAEIIKEKIETEEFLERIDIEREILNGSESEYDRIYRYIEKCMARKDDVTSVLRLICLLSLSSGGLKPKILEQLKRDIAQTYGFHRVIAIKNLERAGLLKSYQNGRLYSVIRKALKVTSDDGLLHLTKRIAQYYSRSSDWRKISDVVSLIPGPSFDNPFILPSQQFLGGSADGKSETSSINDAAKVVVVFFIGGCTFAEISALRSLSQQDDDNVEYLVVTTKLINGNTFLKSIMDDEAFIEYY